jgi:cardiolipin synthase
LRALLVEPRTRKRGGVQDRIYFGVSIPNLITLGRVILVPVVFWLLLTGELQAACLAFVVAGISDAVDGFLAKRFGWETELGAYLDSIADKLLIVCIFIALGVTHRLPSWLVILVVSRDVLIVIAVVLSWLLDHPTPMKPLAVSKMNTVVQIVLAGTVLADEAFALNLKGPVQLLILLTAATTVVSLAAYLRIWLRHMTFSESTGSKT